MFEALYYPDHDPKERWLRRYLLVYDRIRTIVPKQANHIPEMYIRELRDVIPDCIAEESPSSNDVSFNERHYELIEKAFIQIKEEEKKIKKQINPKIVKSYYDPSIRQFYFEPAAGETFIHDSKVNDRILNLLEENKLVYPENEEYTKGFGREDYMVVNEGAGNIIVSVIADNIAKQKGLNTVTDLRMDFAVNSINALSFGVTKEHKKDILANAIIKFEIPEGVERLSLKEFKELRNIYADIREPLQITVDKLYRIHNLDGMNNIDDIGDKIRNIVQEFDKEVEKVRGTLFFKRIKKWAPVSIAGITALTGAVVNQPNISITAATVGVGVQFLQAYLGQPAENEADKVKRMFASLKNEVVKKEIEKLI